MSQGGYGPPPPGWHPPGQGPPPYGPPPGWPGGYAPPRPIVPLAPGVLKERNGVVVLLLAMFTCSIYELIWIYRTTDELRAATMDDSLNPGLDVVLTIVTCGL